MQPPEEPHCRRAPYERELFSGLQTTRHSYIAALVVREGRVRPESKPWRLSEKNAKPSFNFAVPPFNSRFARPEFICSV